MGKSAGRFVGILNEIALETEARRLAVQRQVHSPSLRFQSNFVQNPYKTTRTCSPDPHMFP
jgi:hypothetical protein